MATIRIGTRGSPLAMWQANFVANRLRSLDSGMSVEIIQIETSGDLVRDVPLSQMGGDGVFTKAIQAALLDERVDLAVHSLKDLPTYAVAGLLLAAIPPRGKSGDVIASKRHTSFQMLPSGAEVATSSPRRRAQMLNRRPDLKLVEVRGNIDTRLRKLTESSLDALVLAQAGLERLGLGEHITEVLDRAWMLPAVGQGALGLECREDDLDTREALQKLDDYPTHQAVFAERSLLRALGGGCHVPIGADTSHDGRVLILRGVVLSPSGSQRIEANLFGSLDEPEALGKRLADDLLDAGAAGLLTNES